MAYNPLQTLQAIRMQQAQRDALYLDQQNTIKAKRLEAEIQAEKANEIETYERTLKNLEREDQRKQQDFENGIRLMEKEAELSERLGRDIRGELGEITGYKGGSSIAGDEGARRENIARAGVQAKAQDTARAERAAEEKFLRSQAAAEARDERRWEMKALFEGTPEERKDRRKQKDTRRGQLIKTGEMKAEMAPRKEERAEERHALAMEKGELDKRLKLKRLRQKSVASGIKAGNVVTKKQATFLYRITKAAINEVVEDVTAESNTAYGEALAAIRKGKSNVTGAQRRLAGYSEKEHAAELKARVAKIRKLKAGIDKAITEGVARGEPPEELYGRLREQLKGSKTAMRVLNGIFDHTGVVQ